MVSGGARGEVGGGRSIRPLVSGKNGSAKEKNGRCDEPAGHMGESVVRQRDRAQGGGWRALEGTRGVRQGATNGSGRDVRSGTVHVQGGESHGGGRAQRALCRKCALCRREEGVAMRLQMGRAVKCTARPRTERRGHVRAGTPMEGILKGGRIRREKDICCDGDEHESNGSIGDGAVTGTSEASAIQVGYERGGTREKGSRTGQERSVRDNGRT